MGVSAYKVGGVGWGDILASSLVSSALGTPPTLPLFSSWLLGPINAFTAFVEPGDVAVMVVKSERVGGLTSSNDGLHHL